MKNLMLNKFGLIHFYYNFFTSRFKTVRNENISLNCIKNGIRQRGTVELLKGILSFNDGELSYQFFGVYL